MRHIIVPLLLLCIVFFTIAQEISDEEVILEFDEEEVQDAHTAANCGCSWANPSSCGMYNFFLRNN